VINLADNGDRARLGVWLADQEQGTMDVRSEHQRRDPQRICTPANRKFPFPAEVRLLRRPAARHARSGSIVMRFPLLRQWGFA
jgi:hypothetical protein